MTVVRDGFLLGALGDVVAAGPRTSRAATKRALSRITAAAATAGTGRPRAAAGVLDAAGAVAAHARLRRAFVWVDDGWCAGRALVGAELLDLHSSRPVAAVAVAASPWHLAPAVQTVDGVRVLDPLASDGPLTVERWAQATRAELWRVGVVPADEAARDDRVGGPVWVRDFYAAGVKDTVARRAAGADGASLQQRSAGTAAVVGELRRAAGIRVAKIEIGLRTGPDQLVSAATEPWGDVARLASGRDRR